MTSNRFSGDIKLVSIDVDNTLVDSRKLIPKENIEAIKWAHQEKGIHFAINSGRIAASTRHFMEQIGVHECFPSLNGVLLHSWDGRILEEHSVDRDASLKICAMARSLGVGLFAYRHEGWHLDNGQDYWAESEFKASGIEGEMTDIELFFSMMKHGEFGRFYGSVDPQLFMQCMRQYLYRRNEILAEYYEEQERKQREQQMQGTVTWEQYRAANPGIPDTFEEYVRQLEEGKKKSKKILQEYSK